MAVWFVRRAGVARCTTFAAVIGIALPAVLRPHAVVAAAGLGAALVSLLLLAGVRAWCGGPIRPLAAVVALVVLTGLFGGLLLGSARVMLLDRSALGSHVGEIVRARLTITGPVRSSGLWQSATATVEYLLLGEPEAQVEGKRKVIPRAVGEDVLVEVRSRDRDQSSLSQGDIVVLRATVTEPQGKSVSGYDQRSYLRNQGIQVILRAEASVVDVVGSRGGVAGAFDRLRATARSHLSLGPDSRLDELLQGIVMGDTAGIDDGWLEAFRRSGTAHMLSVSGLHVASLAAIMIGMAKLLRAPRFVGFFLAAAAAVLMIPFVGGSPSIVRAAVMIVIVLGGRWVGRGRDQWQIIALAASVILALNPYALYDVGFQLSFSAFAGMILLTAPMLKRLRFLPKTLGENVAVSMAASLGTAPVSLVAFERMSLVSVFANLLVVPLLPVITGLGMASIAFGFAWTGLSTAIDTVLAPILAWMVQASRIFAAAPLLEVKNLMRAGTVLAAMLVVLPAALAVSGRISRLSRLFGYRRMARWLYKRRPVRRHVATTAAATLILGAALCGWAVYPSLQATVATVAFASTGGWPAEVEVRVLDVGQGSAVLVRTPDHKSLLFDGGPEGCGLGKQLGSLGVDRLDVVLVSHPHADHFAGLSECLDSIAVDTFLDRTRLERPPPDDDPAGPAGSQEARSYLELRDRLQRQGCRYVEVRPGMVLDCGGVRVSLFAPDTPLTMVDGTAPWALRHGPPGGDELNADSIVAVVSSSDTKILIPGDAEAESLGEYGLPRIDAILVSHHGSRGALSEGLLGKLEPRLAVVSVGEGNSFGHPDAATLRLLETAGVHVLRTDRTGWVCLRLQNGQTIVTTERRDRP